MTKPHDGPDGLGTSSASPTGQVTHWVDTNVMLEIFSHGDLFDAVEELQRGSGSGVKVENRRLRMQGSLWMAMALCKTRAISVTFEHENLRQMIRLAPPDSERGAWTRFILYVLGDGGMFEGWEPCVTSDGAELKNRARDKHMVNTCAKENLVLIARDAQAIEEARAARVDASEPEAFASRYLTRHDARRMFEERVATATFRYLTQGKIGDHELLMRNGQIIRDAYREIWQPPEQP